MIRKLLAIALFLACTVPASAGSIALDFGGLGKLKFDGNANSFSFEDATVGPYEGYDFAITVSNGVGDSVGLAGKIDGGPWVIGAINPDGSGEKASVTGSGVFSINDDPLLGAGSYLTGDLVFHTIKTDGLTGTLNVEGQLNLTSLSYAGANADLAALAAASSGTLTVTFQFANLGLAKSLTELTADGQTTNIGYSGSVAAVPEPASMAMLTIGGLLAGAYGVRRRKN